MRVFVIGVTGAVGGLLARRLGERGVDVRGLVRRESQRASLRRQGVRAEVGELAELRPEELARLIGDADAVVFTAGSNGGSPEVSRAIDLEGLATTVDAVRRAGRARLFVVSVMPEAARGSGLDADEEYYFAVKKRADVLVSATDLDWVILRPSMLVDEPGTGTVTLAAAAEHRQVPREDVADTLAELVLEPRISRQVLELDQGTVPIADAVRANVRRSGLAPVAATYRPSRPGTNGH